MRYDPLLLSSSENSRPDLNFITPSPFYMLTYHRDRMVEAAQHFDFDPITAKLAVGSRLHQELLRLVRQWQKNENKEDGPLKLRILFDRAGNMTVDFLPIPPVPLTTLYPTSFDPPHSSPPEHPAKQQGALPAGDASQKPQPPQPKEFKPSPLTGGALNLGKGVTLPAGNKDPNYHPGNDSSQAPQPKEFKPSPLTGGALTLGPGVTLPAGNKDPSYIPLPPEWKLKLDTTTTPSSPYTLLKTTKREVYDKSRERALPENPASAVHREVILFNEVNEVTEGTLTSLYFWRGGKWVTPPVGVPEAFKISGSTEEGPDEGELRKPFAGRWGHSVRSAKVGAGGQRGTSRRWALGKGYCMEEPIDVATVAVGERVWVSNGVRGFGFGSVVA